MAPRPKLRVGQRFTFTFKSYMDFPMTMEGVVVDVDSRNVQIQQDGGRPPIWYDQRKLIDYELIGNTERRPRKRTQQNVR